MHQSTLHKINTYLLPHFMTRVSFFFKEKETILQKVKHNFSRDIHTYIFIYYGAYILYDALRGVHNNFAPTHLDLFRKG